MIEIRTSDNGKPIQAKDVVEAQVAYITARAYRRNLFMRAISERRTYKWVAEHSGLSASNIFQLVNKTNYKKK